MSLHIKRINLLREKISDIDAFIITYLPNIFYLTGFTGSSAVMVITKKDALFFTDFRYKEQSAKEIDSAEIIIIKDEYLKEIASNKIFDTAKRIGFEEKIEYSSFITIKKIFKNKKLIPIKNKIEELRKIKDDEEIKNIKMAHEIANSTFDEISTLIKPGVKEIDIAIEFEYRIRKKGAKGPSFPTIVASGENAALPHARAGNRKIKEGDTVIIDYGAIYNNYSSDNTRTIIIGENKKAQKIYEIVDEAQKVSIKAIKPGIKLKEVDLTARKIIEDAGYGEYFGHSLGHGVGIEVHEAPRVSKNSEDVATPGMVFTIEPGIYLPNFGGVRIEDMIVVKKDGYEIIK